ncbi:motility associated factor glycosyltransferase family protein [Agarivorans albus]|uniref:Motility accessory factor n=1 Tax=Agarivorans albus MKT 106 TaxID=1331007 RepID=R9PLZ1_AGAAL|nr:6-hydroxymethylpterin diphosphokinase MptE-like protein [Agarivorans albus]GAD02392.1 hypothetical protein AALB_2472 [Agarivorans albus MKT 106]
MQKQSPLFAKNIRTIRSIYPALSIKLDELAGQENGLKLSPNNDFCINGEPFYKGDGLNACRQQVKQFLSSPNHYSMSFQDSPASSFIHQQAINQLNSVAIELGRKKGKPYSSTLIALGSGIGYYLNILCNEFKLKDIILIEPSDQQLLALCHHCDLSKLVEHCSNLGGEFYIFQPKSGLAFNKAMQQVFERSGWGVLAEMLIYRHYNTQFFDEIVDNFVSYRLAWLSAWGHFDDELIGLNHSIDNAKRHLFKIDGEKALNQVTESYPTLVVGNGPSLDKDIDYISNHQNKFIIVSCGTALAALIKAGIKPDFHAEMERSTFTAKVQAPLFSNDITRNTTLLALNTVSPEITNRFENSLIFLKKLDVGSEAITNATTHRPSILSHCNPTVTNFALAAVANIGLRNIILVGCDYGYLNAEEHHSKHSEYFKTSGPLSKAKYNSTLSVDSVFGDKIYTNRVFNQARKAIENLAKELSSHQVTNSSRGAKIEDVPYIPLKSIGLKPYDKPIINKQALSKHRASYIKLDIRSIALFLDSLAEVPNQLLNKETNAKTDYCSISKYLKQIGCKYPTSSQVIFSGILKYIEVTSTGHLARIPSNKQLDYTIQAQSCLKTMFVEAQHRLMTTKEKLDEI